MTDLAALTARRAGAFFNRSDGSVLIAATGLRDQIIAVHEGSVLIVPKERAQDVRQRVERLQSDAREDRLHRKHPPPDHQRH